MLTVVFPALSEDAFAVVRDGCPGATVRVEHPGTGGQGLLAEIRFEGHGVELASLGSPVPEEVLLRTLDLAPWENDFRAWVRQTNQAHWLVRYSGVHTRGEEQYLALYRFLSSLSVLPESKRPIAVLNEPAYQAHPFTLALRIAQNPEAALDTPPLEFWSGCNGFDLETGTWLLTRGYRLLGQPELAYFPPSGHPLFESLQRLYEVFLYRHQLQLSGKTVQTGDVLWLEPGGYFEILDGRELMQLTGSPYPIEILREVPHTAVSTLFEPTEG